MVAGVLPAPSPWRGVLTPDDGSAKAARAAYLAVSGAQEPTEILGARRVYDIGRRILQPESRARAVDGRCRRLTDN